jgi:hypothetical protein
VSNLIRWNDTWNGSTGQFGPFTFIVSPLYTGEGYLLVPYLPGMEDRRARGSLGEVKATAESWLREFVSSLGALFAASLRKHLEREAATQQELGDDYSDSASPLAESQSHLHWGRAQMCRDLIKYVEHELETR